MGAPDIAEKEADAIVEATLRQDAPEFGAKHRSSIQEALSKFTSNEQLSALLSKVDRVVPAKTFGCSFCTAKFATPNALGGHVRQYHKTEAVAIQRSSRAKNRQRETEKELLSKAKELYKCRYGAGEIDQMKLKELRNRLKVFLEEHPAGEVASNEKRTDKKFSGRRRFG